MSLALMADAPPSPLASTAPWDLVAGAYAAEVRPMFEAFAEEALRAAGVGPGHCVADVACGPGTLSFLAARRGARVRAIDFAPAMIAELEARRREEPAEIEATVGDGMALPWADGTFEAGFSMFGLMFFPDRPRGFTELARVLAPGATCVVTSWASLDRVPLLATAYAALGELMPGPKSPPRAMPLVDPVECVDEMSRGGFRDVEVYEFTGSGEVASVMEFVAHMERANAPIALAKQRLGDAWAPVAEGLRERLVSRFGDGPQALTMPANVIVGRR